MLARSAGHRAIAVVNKVDLPQQLDEKLLKKHFLHIVPLSAKTGDGLDKLLNLIPRTVGLGDGAFDGALITNARQAAALARANHVPYLDVYNAAMSAYECSKGEDGL